MSSSACCMSRHPPSPDGIAPRPALVSPPTIKLDKKAQDLLPLSWSSSSRLSRPEDAAAIQAIFEADKLDSESEHGSKAVSKKTSTGFSAVKNRLKKHLSKESEITVSKRLSRSSVGTTEEEVERRAELRRIRQKRIQEELSSEDVYDEDAKSVSTLCVVNLSPLQQESREASWPPEGPSPEGLSPLTPTVLPVVLPKDLPSTVSNARPVNLFNQRGPTLEALYFGLVSPPPEASIAFEEGLFAESTATTVNSSTGRSRRYSSPAVSAPEFEISEPIYDRPTRKRSSLPQLPKAPMLLPQRLPSIAEPAKSSWRLSFSSDNRGEHLRKLSQGTNIPNFLSSDIASQRQLPKKWFHSQGLRSSSQVIAVSETSNLECPASHVLLCTATQDFGGVDGVGDALHLHEMGISQRLASPQLSSVGSQTHQRDLSTFSAMTQSTQKKARRGLQATTDSLPLSERIPGTWGNIVEKGNMIQDGESSIYPSAGNSIQPSPQSSRFNLFSLLSGNSSKADLAAQKTKPTFTLKDAAELQPPSSTFLSPTIPATPLSRKSVATASAPVHSLPLPSPGYHRRATIDTSSTFLSETESFREREVELSVVRKRFAAAEASRSPSTPRSSKFREEFDFTISTAPEDVTPCKPSAFSRLTKFAARSFDGPFERRVGRTPMVAAYEPEELHHHHSSHTKAPLTSVASPLEDGSVLGFWENAVIRNAEPRTKDVAGKLHLPGKKGPAARKSFNNDIRKKSLSSVRSKDRKKFALKGLGWGMGSETDNESNKEANAEDDWEAELNRVAQKAKGKSRAIVKQYAEPDRRYPASWSKFSSHDREVRVASAKAGDQIAVKDFATDGSEFANKGKKNLRERIQQKLVAEYDKHATTEVQYNSTGTFGRRSSMRPAGDLEYPELEVLPLQTASLMSHEEIAEHVEDALKEEELDRKADELDALFGGPAVKRRDTIKGEIKRVGRKMTPQRVGSNKTSNSRTSNTSTVTSAGKVTENAMIKPSGASTPPNRGPAARRGPVARRPGEQSTPKPTKLAPKMAPAVAMPVRGGATKIFMDGSTDHDDTDSIAVNIDSPGTDDADVSIADPRFYADCVVTHTPRPNQAVASDESGDEMERLNETSPILGRNEKGKTWSGKDWSKYRHERDNRRSLGTLLLRKSTDDVLCELKKMEKVERENALKAAKEAWGGE